MADSGVPPVSDTGERNVQPRLLARLAHADARESGEETAAQFCSAQAKRERREQASAKRASRPPGRTGKTFLFSFFFSFLI
jgi:hypothetical protein